MLYRKTNYAFIQKTKNSELYVLIDKIRDLVWDLNTLVKFSIYFDKEMCLETINKTGLKISDHRLNEIWERATTPIALSFEKRRMLHLLTLIRENYAWDVISERCQYFEANYHHVASIVEVTKKLKSTYSNVSKNQALKILQEEHTEVRQRHKDFNQWFKTLTKDEQLVVVYLQKVIELRDERKDDLNKAIVPFYRIAQKTFKEANIPEELIYYYTLDEIIKGKGLGGIVSGVEYRVGSEKLARELGAEFGSLEKDTREGKTPVILAANGRALAVVMVADQVKPEAVQAVKDLHALGIKVVMVTGDDKNTAQFIAKQVGIDEVVAEVLPEDKMNKIKELQASGTVVAMAGDGVNDAPALAQADVGIAMATGTDVAIESAGITLLHGDISKLVKAVRLSKMTMRGIKQNLFWAFIYNIVGIPLASGILFPVFGWLLSPVFAGFAMAFSSVSVVGNSLRIKAKSL